MKRVLIPLAAIGVGTLIIFSLLISQFAAETHDMTTTGQKGIWLPPSIVDTPSAVSFAHALVLCNYAHNAWSDKSEQACANAQAQTNTEYLCDSTGTTCWLEQK